MEIWKTLRVSHISTPPAATDKCRTTRYTNIPLGTKDLSGHIDIVKIQPYNGTDQAVNIFHDTVDPNYQKQCSGTISPSRLGDTVYLIKVLARNRPTLEYLTVRFNSEDKRWEYRYKIQRLIKSPHYNPVSKMAEGEVLKVLVDEPWNSSALIPLNPKKVTVH
jgi:hypothetical protein